MLMKYYRTGKLNYFYIILLYQLATVLIFLFSRLCNLPVCEDTDEAPFVYGYLCKLIESHHPMVLGANNSNIPSLIQIISEAFLRDAIDRSHAVAQRMIMIVKQIQVIKVYYVGI